MKLPMEINELFIFSCWNILFFKIPVKLTGSNLLRKLYHCILFEIDLSHVILNSFLRAVAVQTRVKCAHTLPSCKE